MNLVSFDIFDTTLLRSCDTEDNVFAILAYSILGDDASEAFITEFIRIRKNSEVKAKKELYKKEMTTTDVYSVADFSSITDVSSETILLKEYEIQSAVLYPRKSTLELIKQHREKGASICFISDMHLPAHVIKEALDKYGIFQAKDKLFVSSEIGKTKASGELFDYVRSEYTDIKSWEHYGDNPISDFKSPKIKGIKAHLVSLANAPYYTDKYQYYQYGHPIGWGQSFQGLQKILCEDRKDTYSNMISEISAPLFVSYVYELLEDAMKRNIKRLYFFSRDGYVLYKIAQRFSEMFPNLDLHYLYVSRRTLYLPSIDAISLDAFLELKTVKGLSTEEYLDQFHIDANSLSYSKAASVMQELQQIFSERDNVKFIKKEKQQLTESLLAYFRQEGVLDDNVAMVDMTGSRSSQEAINRIFKQCGLKDIFAYYFLVSQDRKSIREAGNYHSCIYADYLCQPPYRCLGDLVLLFEDVFSLTTQNRTIGYRRDKEKTIPIFDDIDQNWKKNMADINLQIYLSYTSMYIQTKLYLNNSFVKQYALFAASKFAENPYYKYVAALKELSLSENGKSEHSLIGNPFSKNKGAWFRGSLVSLGFYMNPLINTIVYLKKHRR